MLDNCYYDKVKLAYKLSCLIWFIEKHAQDNAQKKGDEKCIMQLSELKKDLEKHLEKLKPTLCK